MHFIVKSATGKKINLNMEPENSILQVKQQIQEKDGIDIAQIKLLYTGKPLQDEKKLSEYKVEAGSTIHVIYNLR